MCPLACSSVSSVTQCVERPGCVYSTRFPGSPADRVGTVPAFSFPGVISYPKVNVPLGACIAALGSGSSLDLRGSYEEAVLSNRDIAFDTSFAAYAALFNGSGPYIASVPDAGRPTARQSALAVAQAQVCGPITSPVNCTLQRWCAITGKCVAYVLNTFGSAYEVGDPAACPSATPYNGQLVPTGAAHALDSFCAPLAARGCRVCAAAGCRYWHTTNACMNSTAQAADCPVPG